MGQPRDLRTRSPCDGREVIDVAEVLVTGNQGELVLPGDRRDPEVVFRNRAPAGTKQVFDLAIFAGGLRITAEHCGNGCELFDTAHIFLRAGRLFGALVQLADRYAWSKRLIGVGKPGSDSLHAREQVNDDICVQEVSTTHGHRPFRIPVRLPRTSAERPPVTTRRKIAEAVSPARPAGSRELTRVRIPERAVGDRGLARLSQLRG
jgi:hypothetical protein